VPDDFLQAILTFGGQAPTRYNLQPWRFIVARDAENRRGLQAAALGQSNVAEAPCGAGKIQEVESQKKEAVEWCLARSTCHDCCYRDDAGR
jgi:nitroreductase